MNKYEKTIEVNSLVDIFKGLTDTQAEFVMVPTGYLVDTRDYLINMLTIINAVRNTTTVALDLSRIGRASDTEPMDGDATEDLVKKVLTRLNYLEGNLTPDEFDALIDKETNDYTKVPSTCINPDCESDKLNCVGSSHEDEIVIKYYRCLECGTSWNELYRFLNYEKE